MEESHLKSIIKECLEEFFFSEYDGSPFNQLLDRINTLIDLSQGEQRAKISMEISDKFEDYMKNVDKLNGMINEFKRLVSIVRGKKHDLLVRCNRLLSEDVE